MPRIKLEVTGDASKLDRTFTHAGRSAERFGRRVSIGLGSIAKIGGAVLVLDKLRDTIHAGTSEYAEQQKVAAQTNAAIKSTGGIAGVSAKHVDRLALSMSNLSGIDDEVVKSGENVLLTFTKIRNQAGKGNNIFDRATKAAVDWSARTGKTVTVTATAIGKALEDPAGKASGLARAGIVFSKAQLTQISAWQKSGNVLKAQQFILGQIEKRMGGAARAAGQTLPGKLNILKERYKDLAADGIGLIAPAASKAIGGLSDLARRLSEAKDGKAKFKVVWSGLQNLGSDLLSSARRVLQNTDWSGLFDTVADTWGRMVSGLGSRLAGVDWGAVGQRLGRGVIKVQSKVVGALRSVDWSNVGKTIAKGIVKFASNVDWIGVGKAVVMLLARAFEASARVVIGIGKELGAAILRGIGDGLESAGRWLEIKALQIGLKVLKALPNPSIFGRHLIPGLNSAIGSVTSKLAELQAQAERTRRAVDGIATVDITAVTNPDWRGGPGGTGVVTPGAVPKPKAMPAPVDRSLGLGETSGAAAGTPKWKVALDRLLDTLRLRLERKQLTPGLRDDIKVMQLIVDALKKQAAMHQEDMDVQHDLVAAEGELLQLKRQQAQVVAQQAQAERDANRERREALAQAVSQMREQFGQLFQGPVLNPSEEQRKAALGVPGATVEQLVADLKGQNRLFSNMEKALATLGKRGAPERLLQELRGLGPSALAQIQTLAEASPKELRRFFAEYRRRERQVTRVATVILSADSVTVNAKRLVSGGTTVSAAAGAGIGVSMGYHARGGTIGRSRGTDTVPAWLTPGEVVLNRKQQSTIAGKLGVPDSPHSVFAAAQRFADGGVIKTVSGVHREGPGRYSFTGSRGETAPLKWDLGTWLERFYGRGVSRAAGRRYIGWWHKNYGLIINEGHSVPHDRSSAMAISGKREYTPQEQKLRNVYMMGDNSERSWIEWWSRKVGALAGYLGKQASSFAKTMDPRPLMTKQAARAMAAGIADSGALVYGGKQIIPKGRRERNQAVYDYYSNLLSHPIANAGVLAATLPWRVPRVPSGRALSHLEDYTGTGAYTLNASLRQNVGLSEQMMRQYSALMATMAPTSSPARLFRGMPKAAFLESMGLSSGDDIRSALGRMDRSKQFISGSHEEAVARKFVGPRSLRPGVIMDINVPKGTLMADAQAWSKHRAESESILPPGTALRVESIKETMGDYQVKMAVVSQRRIRPKRANRASLALERINDERIAQITAGALPDDPALVKAFRGWPRDRQQWYLGALKSSDLRLARALGLTPASGPLGTFRDVAVGGQPSSAMFLRLAHQEPKASEMDRVAALASAMGMLRKRSIVEWGKPERGVYKRSTQLIAVGKGQISPAALRKKVKDQFGQEVQVLPTSDPGIYRLVDLMQRTWGLNSRLYTWTHSSGLRLEGIGGFVGGYSYNPMTHRPPVVGGRPLNKLDQDVVGWDRSFAQLPDRQRALVSRVLEEEMVKLSDVWARAGKYKMGGVIPGVSVPMLAQGGIAVKPTLALIGERGPEAVVPLGRMGTGTVHVENLIINESANPQATARAVREELGKIARSGVSQRGGRYAGRV